MPITVDHLSFDSHEDFAREFGFETASGNLAFPSTRNGQDIGTGRCDCCHSNFRHDEIGFYDSDGSRYDGRADDDLHFIPHISRVLCLSCAIAIARTMTAEDIAMRRQRLDTYIGSRQPQKEYTDEEFQSMIM